MLQDEVHPAQKDVDTRRRESAVGTCVEPARFSSQHSCRSSPRLILGPTTHRGAGARRRCGYCKLAYSRLVRRALLQECVRAVARLWPASRPAKLSFFCDIQQRLFEEDRKCGGSTHWATVMRETWFGAKEGRSMRCGTTTQRTARGYRPTGKQPLKQRRAVANQALAAALGGGAVAAHQLLRRRCWPCPRRRR